VQKAFITFAIIHSPIILFDVSMGASLHSVRERSIGVNPIPLWDYAYSSVRLEAATVGGGAEVGERAKCEGRRMAGEPRNAERGAVVPALRENCLSRSGFA